MYILKTFFVFYSQPLKINTNSPFTICAKLSSCLKIKILIKERTYFGHSVINNAQCTYHSKICTQYLQTHFSRSKTQYFNFNGPSFRQGVRTWGTLSYFGSKGRQTHLIMIITEGKESVEQISDF